MIPWTATWAGSALAAVMAGAWITRAMDARWVDVAWISLYLVGCLWIAWEWRTWMLPRILRPTDSSASETPDPGSDPRPSTDTPAASG